MSLLEVRNIDVSYGDVQVIFDLSLKIEEGEVVSIIGGNGSGKSTLLRTISGLMQTTAGDITFNGAPILDSAFAAVECQVVQIVEIGDHHIVVGEVTQAHVHKQPEGRPDAAILEMKDLGDHIFYGG